MDLEGKVVVVTGSTTGIGRAIAKEAANQGANVLVTGRDAERGQAVAQSIGNSAVFHEDNLEDPHSAERIISKAVASFGKLDALVNNAAWVLRADLDSTDAELFTRVMNVNVRSPFLLIKAATPHLRQTKGCVVNIGSVNGFGGERNLLPYSVSKGALMTLSKNLADALAAQQVRLYHFNVGWVLTENEYDYKLADGLPENWPDQLTSTEIPSGKMTTPAQIANAVSFWLSGRARPFSGTVMELEQYPFEGRNPTREEPS